MDLTFAGAYFGGWLTLFAPCAALMLPGFFAFATASRRDLLAKTGIFTLGILVALAPLGFLAGSLGSLLRTYQSRISLVLGLLIAVLGIWQAFSLPFPHFSRKAKPGASVGTVGAGAAKGVTLGQSARAASLPAEGGLAVASHPGEAKAGGVSAARLSANAPAAKPAADNSGMNAIKATSQGANPLATFGLGAGYALAGVGCSGPILGAMLALAGLGGSPVRGGFMMLFYGLGMATPVVILAFIWDYLQSTHPGWLKPTPMKVLGRWTTRGAFFSGILFVILGLLLAFTGGSNHLPSLMTADTQVELESSLSAAFTAVPNWLFVLLLVAIVALIVVWRRGRKQAS
ncbi:hypothetical protein BK816_08850 [Boudabousia tangfeifanii]|uniref:Uncharacterized protein n=1 Tax=Boudabousia tangfeifanii TaxID=1912795 RepID=A0A1D9MM56_9ACTO|nr:cytochrome c biogenesis protein CcdA [Boudabousia tangfeifanii]AOZ73365.1 hypothetical protein BK816_08850 [Boudabousia tangfeifanii]